VLSVCLFVSTRAGMNCSEIFIVSLQLPVYITAVAGSECYEAHQNNLLSLTPESRTKKTQEAKETVFFISFSSFS
jgi:hypothetical protein